MVYQSININVMFLLFYLWFSLKAALGLAMLQRFLIEKLNTEKIKCIFCLKAALGLVILFARPPFVSQDPGSQAAEAGLHSKCNFV